jgi:nitrite reductase (cytochrome c-552)
MDPIKKRNIRNWSFLVGTILIVFVLGTIATSIIERKYESSFAGLEKKDIKENEPRNEVWGQQFPQQYESYMATKDTAFKSMYNGSAMIDELESDPKLVVLWAGYAFSKEYNQGRGHAYAVKDVRNNLRTGSLYPTDTAKGMPGTCWTCKSPDVPRYMAEKGVAAFYKTSFEKLGPEIVNPIGCADCHDSKTMNLTITRPALVEAFKNQGKDIKTATHNEMRSLVCAQCHVEYYFDKKTVENPKVPYLTFPWKYGMKAEDMEKYYDEKDFTDWVHPISKAKMIKAQHPGYETFSTGIHAKKGVSCADCHMPYKTEGGTKFTDHHIQSPLNNTQNSCQVCHRDDSKSLMEDVYTRQMSIKQNVESLEDNLVKAHIEAGEAWKLGATEAQMKGILMDIRHAQWRWDYSTAAHGASFHAPVEISRTVASGLAIALDARVKLARLLVTLGQKNPVAMPDISTKAKAQAYIGLDMNKINAAKTKWKKEVLPTWDKKAKERESHYGK